MKWYLIVVLIWICLTTNDVDHLFIYLLAICIPLDKCLFNICILKPHEMESKLLKFSFFATLFHFYFFMLKAKKAIAILFSMIFYFNLEDVDKMIQKHIIRKAECVSFIERVSN